MSVVAAPETDVSAEAVAQARRNASQSGRTVLEELEAITAMSGAPLQSAIAARLGWRYLSLAALRTLDAKFDQLRYSECMRRGCTVAVQPGNEALLILIADPFDVRLARWRAHTFPTAQPVLVHPDELGAWLSEWEERLSAVTTVRGLETEAPNIDARFEELDLARIEGDASPVVQFVNSAFLDALKAGASDVHLESDGAGLVVKYRLDGVLALIRRIDGTQFAEQTISRLKVMADLDIAERRVPQDGRLQLARSGRLVDVRVSIMPSIHGEDAVLRILDRQALARSVGDLSLTALGFQADIAAGVRRLARMPHGMLLVTGPTGSGKTTSLYAALTETHDARDKTVTIEDPVEYQLPGILQIPVHEKRGLTFARGLRSILRHDPDRILVGEIRDAETAQIAVQSALTGHTVFTTVHANSVLDVFGRFNQFGIDAYSFVSSLNGVLAQRLVRRLCAHCAQSDTPTNDAFEVSKVLPTLRRSTSWKRAGGCAECRGTGYRGRLAIGELLVMAPELRSLIAQRAPFEAIEAAASRGGWVSLRHAAVLAASQGITSLEEADRVTSP